MRKIYLIGLPGSGKTTLGRLLAVELELPFIDLDEEIEKSEGKSINHIFERQGETYFRNIESKKLQTIAHENESFILATGGGAPCFHGNMDFMNNNGITIYLNVSPKELYQRLANQTGHRPLLKSKVENDLLKEIAHKYKARSTYYILSQMNILGDNLKVEDLVSRLKKD